MLIEETSKLEPRSLRIWALRTAVELGATHENIIQVAAGITQFVEAGELSQTIKWELDDGAGDLERKAIEIMVQNGLMSQATAYNLQNKVKRSR